MLGLQITQRLSLQQNLGLVVGETADSEQRSRTTTKIFRRFATISPFREGVNDRKGARSGRVRIPKTCDRTGGQNPHAGFFRCSR